MDWLPYLPLLNLLLVPLIGAILRLVWAVRDIPIMKQRIGRLEKHAFGLDGLPADFS